MILPLLLSLPWLLLFVGFAAWQRRPRPLPEAGTGWPGDGARPLVSVIVPARNEADVIRTCVGSLVGSRYPAFEVIVVDDRSEDRTGEIAREAGAGNARRLVVLDGEPLPAGWLGKPWACRQGHREARGDLLLFTDADTRHGPELLERAVAALERDGADALSAVGRQLMETWWEKLVLPQVFALILARFPRLRDPIEPGRCGRAIASGQFVLVRRDAYEGVGGHEAVRGEVVEDLQLARALCRGGHRLTIREAGEALATRMYRSFPHMVEGWTKNLAVGSMQSLPPGARIWALPLGFLTGVALWLAPPAVLVAGLAGLLPDGATVWGTSVYLASAFFWAALSREMRVGSAWGLLYPVGSAITSGIFARSALRGRRVEWKGRTYEVDRDRMWRG